MAGLPVLTSGQPEMKRLVEAESVGFVAEEDTVEGFKKVSHYALGQNYTDIQAKVFAARRKYSWEEQEKTLKIIYQSLLFSGPQIKG